MKFGIFEGKKLMRRRKKRKRTIHKTEFNAVAGNKLYSNQITWH